MLTLGNMSPVIHEVDDSSQAVGHNPVAAGAQPDDHFRLTVIHVNLVVSPRRRPHSGMRGQHLRAAEGLWGGRMFRTQLPQNLFLGV